MALAVPLSSLLGLAIAMSYGAEAFFEVWGANLWGDLAFTAGTMAALVAAARFVPYGTDPGHRRRLALAAPLSFLLHWTVYALSWLQTGAALDHGHFLSVNAAGLGESYQWTLGWGWPGLLAMSIYGPVLAWRVQRAGDPVAAPAPPA